MVLASSRIIGSGETFKGVVRVCFTLYHMMGPNKLDQKGNPNTSSVIGYQNVPRHHTQENFPACHWLRQSSLQFSGRCSLYETIYNRFYDSVYNSEMFMSHL